MLSVLRRSLCRNNKLINRIPFILSCRSASAWINIITPATADVNVESIFVDNSVQELLKKLTGLNAEKIFAERVTDHAERSHFALMTDRMLEDTRATMRERARHFLQFVPVKEPREEKFAVLSVDSGVSNFDMAKYVFTDITFDATNQDRTVVIREVDGTLRTALPEEHDRMNRIYYEQDNRPPFPPAVFRDPDLQAALENDQHEFVMDFATWFYEPEDPEFVKLSKTVFDRTAAAGKFGNLQSTRHFGAFVFYLVLNDSMPPLLNYYGGVGNLSDAANLIRLQKAIYPNWRTSISYQDDDRKIVRDFVSQNRRLAEEIPDLLVAIGFTVAKTVAGGARKQEQSQPRKPSGRDRMRATVNRENLSSADGPLGDLSTDYQVKTARVDRKADQENAKGKQTKKDTKSGKKGDHEG